jgi:DNA-directed RNA polymerase alpha subunit
VNSTDGTEADLQAEFDRGVATGRRQAFAEAMEMMGRALEATPLPPARFSWLPPETTINQLGLPTGIYNMLHREGLYTIEHVLRYTTGELREIRNFGARSVEILDETLARYGHVRKPGPHIEN